MVRVLGFPLVLAGLMLLFSFAPADDTPKEHSQGRRDCPLPLRAIGRVGSHRDLVETLDWAPDGKTVASGSRDGTARIWDAATGKELQCWSHGPHGVRCVAFAPNGRLLAASTGDRKVQIWEPVTGKLRWRILQPNYKTEGGKHVRRFLEPDEPLPIAFSQDGQTLAVGGTCGTVHFWSVATGKKMRTILESKASDDTFSVAFSPDGKVVAASPGQLATDFWDLTAQQPLPSIEERRLRAVHFSPDPRIFAAVASVKVDSSLNGDTPFRDRIILWDLTSRKELPQFRKTPSKRPGIAGSVLSFSRDGKTLATARSDGGSIALWEVATGAIIRTLPLPYRTRALVFSPDGKRLASAGDGDFEISIWDVTGLAGQSPAHPMTTEEMDNLWADLTGEAPKGFQAVQTLGTIPAQAVPLMKKHLRPVPESDTKRLSELIRDLSSRQYLTRKKAMTELAKEGELAEYVLRRTLADTLDLELRLRIEVLLRACEGAQHSPEVLRVLRAVQVLELIGKAEAKTLLGGLAKGAPEAWLTLEAKEAVKRLERRTSE